MYSICAHITDTRDENATGMTTDVLVECLLCCLTGQRTMVSDELGRGGHDKFCNQQDALAGVSALSRFDVSPAIILQGHHEAGSCGTIASPVVVVVQRLACRPLATLLYRHFCLDSASTKCMQHLPSMCHRPLYSHSSPQHCFTVRFTQFRGSID